MTHDFISEDIRPPMWVLADAQVRIAQLFIEAGYNEDEVSSSVVIQDWDDRDVLIWEEGPSEWALDWSAKITEALDGLGIFCEPVNHCVLAFYPA